MSHTYALESDESVSRSEDNYQGGGSPGSHVIARDRRDRD
jgi:hypothetical protein